MSERDEEIAELRARLDALDGPPPAHSPVKGRQRKPLSKRAGCGLIAVGLAAMVGFAGEVGDRERAAAAGRISRGAAEPADYAGHCLTAVVDVSITDRRFSAIEPLPTVDPIIVTPGVNAVVQCPVRAPRQGLTGVVAVQVLCSDADARACTRPNAVNLGGSIYRLP